MLKETNCQAVKLEGGAEQADVIAALVAAGIPVMAHCGLRPQSVHQLGGYKVQRDEAQLLADAEAAEAAGAFAVVLECIPAEMATRVTAKVKIPTIGIGAGAGCDGQVLVTHDLLGLTSGYVPKFVKAYADLRGVITQAVTQFRDDVRSGQFPGPGQQFNSEACAARAVAVGWAMPTGSLAITNYVISAIGGQCPPYQDRARIHHAQSPGGRKQSLSAAA